MLATLLALVTMHCCDNNTINDGDSIIAVEMTLVLVVVGAVVVTPTLFVTMTIDSKVIQTTYFYLQ